MQTTEFPKRDSALNEGELEGYDSDVDGDEEESARKVQLEKLRVAAKTQPNQIERAKAEAKLQRMMAGGALHRQLAKYRTLSDAAPNANKLLVDNFGITPTFPVKQLLCRYHLDMLPDGSLHQPHQGLSNQILYVSSCAADVIMFGTHPSVCAQCCCITLSDHRWIISLLSFLLFLR